jgi:hypothetical protein
MVIALGFNSNASMKTIHDVIATLRRHPPLHHVG